MSTSDDRLALVTSCDGDGDPSSPPTDPAAQLPWIIGVVYRRRRPAVSAAGAQLFLLSAALALATALLLVQMALLRDAAHVTRVGGYAIALQVALGSATLALPAGLLSCWRGGRLRRPARLSAASALAAAAAVLVLAGRRRGRLYCNAQDPLVAVLAVFALVAHLLTTPKLRMRTTIAQVIICLGVFIGVSYQACNKYRCHGDDHSVSWRSDQTQLLWLSTGTAGLALLCAAGLLLERSRRQLKCPRKKAVRTWWDSIVSTAFMCQMALLLVLLMFWSDFIPGFGESASLSETWTSVQRAMSSLSSSHRNYLQSTLLTSAAGAASTLLSIRLLDVGRPVFHISVQVCLGVLLSQLWWSMCMVDGVGGWRPHPRITGEAVTGAVGGLLVLGGLAAWSTFENHRWPKQVVTEFDVFGVQRRLVADGTC